MTEKVIHFTKVGEKRWNFFTPDFSIHGKIYSDYNPRTGESRIVTETDGVKVTHPSMIAAKRYAGELVVNKNPREKVKALNATVGKYHYAVSCNRPESLGGGESPIVTYKTKKGADIHARLLKESGLTGVEVFQVYPNTTLRVDDKKWGRGINPVPKGIKAATKQAVRRYESFRDQKHTGMVKIKSPDYRKGAKHIGYCEAIDYTTFRGEDNKKEKYRHDFKDSCAPGIVRSGDGHFWSQGGKYRFTYRGFLDQPSLKASKATLPPFPTGMVVGYLDAIHLTNGKKLVSTRKKVLLCVSESGYNFFTVLEP